jgi:DNA-binding response OmpR family regulator
MVHSIVLAEDSLEHCFFFKKALKEVAPDIQLTCVNDGDKLVKLLESYLPDLLFLDLAMPCKDGVQCIKELRESRAYDNLPIIVFTVSSQEHTIQTTYSFGANLYFIKPAEYALLVSSLRKILAMDWIDSKKIKGEHFYNQQYVPFGYHS